MNKTQAIGTVTFRRVYEHDFNDPDLFAVVEEWEEWPAVGDPAFLRDYESEFGCDVRVTAVETRPHHKKGIVLLKQVGPIRYRDEMTR